MMIKDFFNIELMVLAGKSLLVWQLVSVLSMLVFGYILIKLLLFKWIPTVCENNNIDKSVKRSVRRTFSILFLLLAVLITMFIVRWDYIFLDRIDQLNISARLIIEALIIFQLARLADWFIFNVFFYHYYKSRDQFMADSDKDSSIVGGKTSATGIIQYIVYTIAAMLIISNFNLDFELYDINYKRGDNNGEVLTH